MCTLLSFKFISCALINEQLSVVMCKYLFVVLSIKVKEYFESNQNNVNLNKKKLTQQSITNFYRRIDDKCRVSILIIKQFFFNCFSYNLRITAKSIS